MDIKIQTNVIDGQLQIDLDEINSNFKPSDSFIVELTITKKSITRSLQQNAYYWGIVIPTVQSAIRELGERLNLNETEEWLIDMLGTIDKDFIHLFLKEKFIDSIKVDESTGEIIKLKPSTRTMSKETFSDYISRIIQFANEHLQVEIPEAE